MNSIQKTARFAGCLYLLIAVCAGFSFGYMRTTLIVPGDVAATVSNLLASEWLFRLGIVGDAIVFLSEIVLIALLYALLRPVSKILSLAAVYARLAMVVMQGELPLALWLLMKGINVEQWKKRAFEAS